MVWRCVRRGPGGSRRAQGVQVSPVNPLSVSPCRPRPPAGRARRAQGSRAPAKVKSTGLAQTSGRLSQPLIGTLSQTAGSTGKVWVNPVHFRFGLVDPDLGLCGQYACSCSGSYFTPKRMAVNGSRGWQHGPRQCSSACVKARASLSLGDKPNLNALNDSCNRMYR
jgi:hypothetical protein